MGAAGFALLEVSSILAHRVGDVGETEKSYATRDRGTGSEVMQRIAVPMIGGMISSTVLTLVVIPAVYGWIKGWGLSPGAAPVFGHVTGHAR